MQWLIEIFLTRTDIYVSFMLGLVLLIYIIIFIVVKLSIREQASESGSSESQVGKSHTIHANKEST
jgi:hypothetical protein